MNLDHLTATVIDAPKTPQYALDDAACFMLFGDDPKAWKAWQNLQIDLRHAADRQSLTRPKLIALTDKLAHSLQSSEARAIADRAERAYLDGLARGLLTVRQLETADAREALRLTREAMDALGKPYDKHIYRNAFGPTAHLWASHVHFRADKVVPCKPEHFRDFLGMAAAYERELDGKDLVRIPTHLLPHLPHYVVQEVGERRSGARAAPKALRQPGGLPL